MKRALIIGITGQDGAYLSQLLLKEGYEVYGITRNTIEPDLKNLEFLQIDKQVQLIELPNLDKDRIVQILKRFKFDEIYNLSAQSSVGQSFIDPIGTVNFNILSVLYWLEAIKTVNKDIRFYQASSSEMFGNVSPQNLPLTESLVFHPASPYGVSKAAAHWLTVNYRESNNLFAACGILFNHESCLRGSNYVVKKIVNAAIKIKMGLRYDPILVGNLAIRRDWGYAPNYVEAMYKMLQHDKADDFLICSGNEIELDALIAIIFKQLGLVKEDNIQIDPSLFRPVDLKIIYGDNTKAKNELAWDYQMSNEQLAKQLLMDETKFIEWELSRQKR
jgi:GDPmannose 4,6-dehydratase